MVDSIIFTAIETVSKAIQSKRVVGEGETKVVTPAFLMKVKRSSITSINTTVVEGSNVRVEIPDLSTTLKGYGNESVDIQVYNVLLMYNSLFD